MSMVMIHSPFQPLPQGMRTGARYFPFLSRAIPFTTSPAIRLRLTRIISDEEKKRVTTIMGSFKLNEMISREMPKIRKKIKRIARRKKHNHQ
jgi:hypothetical protein